MDDKKSPDFIDSFYSTKYAPEKHNPNEEYQYKIDSDPKYTILDEEEFNHGRKVLGQIIVKNMKASGGTDIDWLIEHRGGFIIFEFKKIHHKKFTIRKGQMIAYESLYNSLNQNKKKCYMYFIGTEEIDFTNPNFPMRWFEMSQWKNKSIVSELVTKNTGSKSSSRYLIDTEYLDVMTLEALQQKIDAHWKEFEAVTNG